MLKKFKLNTNNLNFEHMYSQKYKILYECIKSVFFYKCHKTDDLKKKRNAKSIGFSFLIYNFFIKSATLVNTLDRSEELNFSIFVNTSSIIWFLSSNSSSQVWASYKQLGLVAPS